MKLQNANRWSFRTPSSAVVIILGLLAYGYAVVAPGYSGWIDDYRFTIFQRYPVDSTPIPMTITMPAMAAAGEHHKSLRLVMDIPGVTNPKLVDMKSTLLTDMDRVFGVIVNGKAFAFARQALLSPNHIVNLMLEQTPISVGYCDLTDCVRVLTRDGRSGPINLHVGGLDIDYQMVLLFDGIRYDLSSTNIPLQDVTFEKTTLGDWKQRHPNTMVYEDRKR